MTNTPVLATRRKTLLQKWQRLVHTKLWLMDIHPTAWIAPTALIDRTWPKGIHIGAGCIIDHHAVVLTHDRTRGFYRHTRIGDGTSVGPRAIVMPGVTVGSDCIIEAGSVVTRDVPDGSRILGNPGQIVP